MRNIHKKKPELSAAGANLKYRNAKEQLAKDFNYRCGYCDDSHNYVGGSRNYHIDHFAPKSKFEHLKDYYGNFVYSCPYCNLAKSNKWVGSTAEENVIGEQGFINPCNEKYAKHIKRADNGQIVYITPLGKYMYNELKLYLKRHEIFYQLDEIDEKIKLMKEKIKIKIEFNQNVEKHEKMLLLLYEAYHYYTKNYHASLSPVV